MSEQVDGWEQQVAPEAARHMLPACQGRASWSRRVAAGRFLPRGVPHAYEVIEGPAAKLILAVPGGIEHLFDDLAAGVSLDDLIHRHRVRFLD